jgi:hypothetical protein
VAGGAGRVGEAELFHGVPLCAARSSGATGKLQPSHMAK